MEERDVKPWDLLNPAKPRSSEATQQARLSICESCPIYQPTLHRCGDCGCIMPLKVKLAEAHCPQGKWMAE